VGDDVATDEDVVRDRDRPTAELDDEDDDDRNELRQRHYGLLQELRVVLPGVQVLMAFLLTAPFAQRFDDLDEIGRDLYGVALTSSALAVVALMMPTTLHRFGVRTARRQRLRLGIASTRLGLVLLAVSMVSAMIVIARFVFTDGIALLVGGLVTGSIVVGWIVVPVGLRLGDRAHRRQMTNHRPLRGDDMGTTCPEPGPNPTDTPLLRVLRSMADRGFAGQLRAEVGAEIRCFTCRTTFSAHGIEANDLTRLEGVSDPDDMLAVVAVTCPNCSTGGALVLNFGPTATREDVDALAAFERDPSVSSTDIPGT